MNILNMLKSVFWMATIVVVISLTGFSCTKLDVNTYSTVSNDNFWKTAAEVEAGKAPAYAQLASVVGHNGYGNYHEVSSDDMIYPTRGTDWEDGGTWARMYYHTYDKNDVDGNLNGVWSDLNNGAGQCNFITYTLQNLATPPANLANAVAEMAALRSYYYYLAMDLFGNIPYVTNFKVDPITVTNIPRAQVFDSLEANIKAALPNLSANVDASTYGKVNKYFAFSLLARMYLNSKVYTGRDRSADCIAMCDSVLSGPFVLESNYFEPFYGVNNTSLENIFVVPFGNNGVINGNGTWEASLQFNSALTFGIPCCGFGNNGASATADYYKYFDTLSSYTQNTVVVNGRTINNILRTFNDQRSGQWLIGQQFQGDGIANWPPSKNWVVDNDDPGYTYNGDGSVALHSKIGDDSYGFKTPVIYYDKMTEFNNSAPTFRHAGVRNVKFWPQPGPSTNHQEGNAFPVFRLADIILMRGEAYFNTGKADLALADFNTIRTRAYSGNTDYNWKAANLTPDNILAERARELAWENVRRTDIIRFGKYLLARQYPPKPADNPDGHTLILPIPLNQLNTNKNLKQNPGY
jgi:hypothetical protein